MTEQFDQIFLTIILTLILIIITLGYIPQWVLDLSYLITIAAAVITLNLTRDIKTIYTVSVLALILSVSILTTLHYLAQ